MKLSLVALLMIPMFLVSCKTRNEIRREQELDRLREEVREAKGDRADVEGIVEELRAEVGRLNGRIEELASSQKQLEEQVKKDSTELSGRFQKIEEKTAQEETAERNAAAERAKSSFESAKKLYEEGQYEEAIEMLRNLKGRVKGDEAKKVQFLLAETYFTSKDYASSALEFSEFKKNYAKDPLAANATYRQAQSFRAMKKTKEARLFYQEVINDFPKHALAKKSKDELKALK